MSKYTVWVREAPVCIAHQLHLPYESKCNRLHGHNYVVRVKVAASELDNNGMVVDFTKVKAVIKKYDHSFLGTFPGSVGTPDDLLEKYIGKQWPHIEPSTAENFARILFEEIREELMDTPACVKEVRVSETPSTEVIYRASP